MKLNNLLQDLGQGSAIGLIGGLFLLVAIAVLSWGTQSYFAPYESPTAEQKLETCQQTVDELANAVTILAVTHKAGLVGTTCMVDMDTDELELGQRFKACKLAWDKQGEEDGLE